MFRFAQKEHLIVPAHIDHLASLRDFVTQIGAKYGYSYKLVNAFKIAIDEAATNIIRHAYNENEGYITIQAIIRRKSLTINIIDQGAFFDPKWAKVPDLKETANHGEKVGLGIMIMRKLMDEIDYRKTEAGNELSLTKIEKASPKRFTLSYLWNLPPALKLRYFVNAIVLVTLANAVGFAYYYRQAEQRVMDDFFKTGRQVSKQIGSQISAVRPGLLSGEDGESYLSAIILPVYDEHFGQIYSVSVEDTLGRVAWSTILAEVDSLFARPEIFTRDGDNAISYNLDDSLTVYEFESPLLFSEGTSGYRCVRVLLSKSYVDSEIQSKQVRYIKLGLLSLGLTYILLAFLSYAINNPVRKLSKWVRDTNRGEVRKDMDIDASSDIGEIAQAFSDITERFNETQKHLEYRERYEREINLAREIQESLLPSKMPDLPDFEIATYYEAAATVGGDYYDFIQVDKDRLGIVIADVAGKGVPGCMVMTMIRTALKTEARGAHDAADVLTRVNDFVANDMKHGMFVTVFYMIIDTRTATANFASAGHTPLILHQSQTGKSFYINPIGCPVGISLPDKNFFRNNIESETVQLAPGDTLVLYTDGITEARNPRQDEYGEERLLRQVRSHGKLPPESFVDKLKNAIYSFREDGPLHDDITIVTFRRKLRDDEEDKVELDEELLAEQKFVSIEDTTKLLDVIASHPEFEAEQIAADLKTERYQNTEIPVEKVEQELRRQKLHTQEFRQRYANACRKEERNPQPPGTPTLALNGSVKIARRPKVASLSVTQIVKPEVAEPAAKKQRRRRLKPPKLTQDKPTSLTPDIEADFVFGDFLDHLISSTRPAGDGETPVNADETPLSEEEIAELENDILEEKSTEAFYENGDERLESTTELKTTSASETTDLESSFVEAPENKEKGDLPEDLFADDISDSLVDTIFEAYSIADDFGDEPTVDLAERPAVETSTEAAPPAETETEAEAEEQTRTSPLDQEAQFFLSDALGPPAQEAETEVPAREILKETADKQETQENASEPVFEISESESVVQELQESQPVAPSEEIAEEQPDSAALEIEDAEAGRDENATVSEQAAEESEPQATSEPSEKTPDLIPASFEVIEVGQDEFDEVEVPDEDAPVEDEQNGPAESVAPDREEIAAISQPEIPPASAEIPSEKDDEPLSEESNETTSVSEEAIETPSSETSEPVHVSGKSLLQQDDDWDEEDELVSGEIAVQPDTVSEQESASALASNREGESDVSAEPESVEETTPKPSEKQESEKAASLTVATKESEVEETSGELVETTGESASAKDAPEVERVDESLAEEQRDEAKPEPQSEASESAPPKLEIASTVHAPDKPEQPDELEVEHSRVAASDSDEADAEAPPVAASEVSQTEEEVAPEDADSLKSQPEPAKGSSSHEEIGDQAETIEDTEDQDVSDDIVPEITSLDSDVSQKAAVDKNEISEPETPEQAAQPESDRVKHPDAAATGEQSEVELSEPQTENAPANRVEALTEEVEQPEENQDELVAEAEETPVSETELSVADEEHITVKPETFFEVEAEIDHDKSPETESDEETEPDEEDLLADEIELFATAPPVLPELPEDEPVELAEGGTSEKNASDESSTTPEGQAAEEPKITEDETETEVPAADSPSDVLKASDESDEQSEHIDLELLARMRSFSPPKEMNEPRDEVSSPDQDVTDPEVEEKDELTSEIHTSDIIIQDFSSPADFFWYDWQTQTDTPTDEFTVSETDEREVGQSDLTAETESPDEIADESSTEMTEVEVEETSAELSLPEQPEKSQSVTEDDLATEELELPKLAELQVDKTDVTSDIEPETESAEEKGKSFFSTSMEDLFGVAEPEQDFEHSDQPDDTVITTFEASEGALIDESLQEKPVEDAPETPENPVADEAQIALENNDIWDISHQNPASVEPQDLPAPEQQKPAIPSGAGDRKDLPPQLTTEQTDTPSAPPPEPLRKTTVRSLRTYELVSNEIEDKLGRKQISSDKPAESTPGEPTLAPQVGDKALQDNQATGVEIQPSEIQTPGAQSDEKISEKTPTPEPSRTEIDEEIEKATAEEEAGKQPIESKGAETQEPLVAYLNAGIRAYRELEYDAAIVAFKEVLQRQPGFVDAYAMLGNAYFRNQMYAQALAAYEQIDMTSRMDFAVTENLGLIYWKLGQRQNAATYWRQILREHPERRDLARRVKFVELEEQKSRAVTASEPPEPKVNGNGSRPATVHEVREETQKLVQAGIKQYRNSDYETAIRIFKHIIGEFPDAREAYTFLGNAYFRNDMLSEAAEIYERLAQMDYENPTAMENLGFIQFKRGSYREAIATWRRLLERHPERHDLKRKISRLSQLI